MTDGPVAFNRISSWDMNRERLSTIHDGPPISTVTPANYIVPYAKMSAQSSPKFSYDSGRLPPQYRQSQPQPMTETFQPVEKNVPVQSKKSWCAKHITVTKVIGLLIGLIAAGIPLAVVITLYAQLDTSSSDSGTASGSSATISPSMPYQCTSYTTWNDDTRLTSYICSGCNCDNGIATTWYRIQGTSATRLTSTPASYGSCGAYYPIWFNATLPTNLYQTIVGTACMYYGSDPCYPSYSLPVPVTNCGSFYVYYLRPVSSASCYYRYCTSA